jgi:hypothetical protein
MKFNQQYRVIIVLLLTYRINGINSNIIAMEYMIIFQASQTCISIEIKTQNQYLSLKL